MFKAAAPAGGIIQAGALSLEAGLSAGATGTKDGHEEARPAHGREEGRTQSLAPAGLLGKSPGQRTHAAVAR